ncbi:TraB/GumN family protein [Caulobacter sp. KR2-114]|uniref:TraB/GumN family protein n=1 Tax=Caulobacter sp. KR2-114 TaxID=3400912 RepID=UPI003C039D8C
MPPNTLTMGAKMGWRKAVALALAAGALLSVPATAPSAAAPERDYEANLVDGLVVNAASGGPAWWTVTAGNGAKVYVLGVPSGLPKGQAWSTAKLEFRLKGASAVILPPTARANPIKAAAFFLFHRKPFESRGPMEDSLPPALRARFVAARTGLGKPATRYAKWKPGVAGLMIGGDFREALKISFKQPDDQIEALADRAHVPRHKVASYDVLPLLKNMASLPDSAHQACLSDSLTEIEAGRERALAAAAGWARGDVRAALGAERGFDKCIAGVPGMSAYIDRSIADTSNAIAAALTKPGRTIAIAPLRLLLARDGVLERLKARGFKVETPATAG